MEVSQASFGQVAGQNVKKFTIINDQQTRISVLSYGATWQEFVVVENGIERPLIWGLDSIERYQQVGFCLGQTIGRVAGRIGQAQFDLDGKTYHVDMNEQHHSLHGGIHGFNTLNFEGRFEQTEESASVILSKSIAAATDHYPGDLQVEVKFTLDNDNRVTIEFSGQSNQTTLFNPTNHVYWNLTDDRRALKDQWLQINSQKRLEFDQEKVPTGHKIPLQNTAYDFNTAHSVQESLDQLKSDNGAVEIDDAFEVTPSQDKPIATIGDKVGRRKVRIYSDRNSLVVYTANPFDPEKQAGHLYNALATEAQTLPDAINHSDFGNIELPANHEQSYSIAYQYLFKN